MQASPLNKAIPSWGAPTLEGFDTTNIQDGRRISGSQRQLVRFYRKTLVEMQAKEVQIDEKTGSTRVLKSEAVPVEREFVEIITPGDKNTVDDIAQDFHRREHWKQYQAFREGRAAPMGTPIDECSFVSSAIATELRILGVQTLEQLADASDYLCNQVPSGWELREYARAMCAANNDNRSSAQVNLLRGELEKSHAAMAEMQKQLKEMKGMLLGANGQVVASGLAPSSAEAEPAAEAPAAEKPAARGRRRGPAKPVGA